MFKILKKYFSIIFVIFFIIIFSVFNREEFIDNYDKKIWEEEQKENISKSLKNFKLENIKDLNNTTFYYTPYKKLLDKITDKILSSKNRVYVEVYMLTETRIKQALVDVKNNGVDVKVVLERNPYKANNINNKHFKFLEDSWVDIVWSNPDLYALNHSKFMIIDDELIISSWNFTYSTFAFNRDLFLFIHDINILDYFLVIFNWDFIGKSTYVYNDNLVLSPYYSREKFETMFLDSKTSLDLYFQYLSDKNLEKILIKKASEWVKIRIVVSEEFYDEKKEKIAELENIWIEIKSLKKIKMHSKAILVDNKYLFIGSINFSNYSLDKNRETWLILINNDIVSNFRQLFNKDFAK